MSRAARFRLKIRQWPRCRQRIAAAILTVSLLIVAFYAIESLRGSLALTAAIKEAQTEGAPVSLAEVGSPHPPKDRNLFFSPVVKNRMLMPEDAWPSCKGAPVSIPWGNVRPRWTGTKVKRLAVDTDIHTGRAVDFTAVKEAMAELGWTLPEKGTPAEVVLGGLERFHTELEEWSAEIRRRPAWEISVENAGNAPVFEKMLTETAGIFGLRAISAAAAERNGAEILKDLESAAILGRHVWNQTGVANPLVWEVLKVRRLTDVELIKAGAVLLEEPLLDMLTRQADRESLACNEGFLSRAAAGQALENSWPDYYARAVAVEREYSPAQSWFRERLTPSGWYSLAEAWELRCMLRNRQRVSAAVAAWRNGESLPNTHGLPKLPWWRHRMPLPIYYSNFGAHLMSCGCQLSTMWGAAVDGRLAMVAIGLERYRLRHGKWPETLTEISDLIPGGLRPLPGSVMPVLYSRLPSGGWQLSGEEKKIRPWIMPDPP